MESFLDHERSDVENASLSVAGHDSSGNITVPSSSHETVVQIKTGMKDLLDNALVTSGGARDIAPSDKAKFGGARQDFLQREAAFGGKRKREKNSAYRHVEDNEYNADSDSDEGEYERRGPEGSPANKNPKTPKNKNVSVDVDLRSNLEKSTLSDTEQDVNAEGPVDIDNNLPDTVTLLMTPEGAKVYLVGTAHFSIESQEDVAEVIRAVRPHVVLVELCKARVNILQLDEKTILEEAKNINFEKVQTTIRQNGLFHGLMYILLLSMSAHITKQLGMAPGGEFRRAFSEAKQFPHCIVHLGDRPIHITLQRALAQLSWWQTARLAWHLLTAKEPISKEEVERCKRRDLLEEMLAEMTGEFPALSAVFVNERDVFLTHSLQLAAALSPQAGEQSRVVGVVGIGHVPGIVRRWGRVRPEDVPPLLHVPPPSAASRALRAAARLSVAGLLLWGVWRLLPLRRSLPLALPLSLAELRTGLGRPLQVCAPPMSAPPADSYRHPAAAGTVAYSAECLPGPGADLEALHSQLLTGCACAAGLQEPEPCAARSGCPCLARYGPGYGPDRLLLPLPPGPARPVLECNASCACDPRRCCNRVVQHGPCADLEVFAAGAKGLGLRALRPLPAGAFVCEYAGELIGPAEAQRRLQAQELAGVPNYVLVVAERAGGGPTQLTCVDPARIGNVGRYLNHSCRPCCEVVPVRVDSPVPHLALFTVRAVAAGEELTFSYGAGAGAGAKPCLCGESNCCGSLPAEDVQL